MFVAPAVVIIILTLPLHVLIRYGCIEGCALTVKEFYATAGKSEATLGESDAALEKSDATPETFEATLEKFGATLEKSEATLETSEATAGKFYAIAELSEAMTKTSGFGGITARALIKKEPPALPADGSYPL